MKRALVLLATIAPASAFAFVILQRDPAGGTGPGPVRWLYTGGTIEYRHNIANAPAGIDGPDLIDQAFDTWTGVPSAMIAFSRGADTTAAGFDFADTINSIAWEDPDDDLEAGVLAATVIWVPTGVSHGYQSQNFYEITQADIVMNDGVTWTDSDGASLLGGCIAGKFDTEAVALHEIGHLFGLDHPPGTYAQAIMFPSIADCDSTRTAPKPDDVDGVTFLYDSGVAPVYPSFSIAESEGYAPFEVAFQDETTGSVSSRTWDFGDGGSSTVANPFHEYAAPGLYDVTLTVNGTAAIEQVDAVTVLQRPTVDFSADVTEGDAPLIVVFTDLSSDVGADPRYRWQLDGQSIFDEVNLMYEFEDPGTYTVTLGIDAGAGYVTEEKEAFITVKGDPEEELFPGCACDVGGRRDGAASLPGLALAAAAILLRRRSR